MRVHPQAGAGMGLISHAGTDGARRGPPPAGAGLLVGYWARQLGGKLGADGIPARSHRTFPHAPLLPLWEMSRRPGLFSQGVNPNNEMNLRMRVAAFARFSTATISSKAPDRPKKGMIPGKAALRITQDSGALSPPPPPPAANQARARPSLPLTAAANGPRCDEVQQALALDRRESDAALA